MRANELENLEIKLLLEGVFNVYGYDFRDYAEASIGRRLRQWLQESGFNTFSEAQSRLLRDHTLFDSFIKGITVNVSEMFRDPFFFKVLREQVVPYLKTYPFVKIWHAGCATGEEAYSMAILLDEEGLKGKYRIYATDINEEILKRAKNGIFPLSEIQRYTQNYQKSGGIRSFADYYTARYDKAILMSQLRENIVFSTHNLATDSDFGEMNMVLCRNVMIYFKPDLKERAIGLFDSSIVSGGFLCLGSKETLENKKAAENYSEIEPKSRVYRKKYARTSF